MLSPRIMISFKIPASCLDLFNGVCWNVIALKIQGGIQEIGIRRLFSFRYLIEQSCCQINQLVTSHRLGFASIAKKLYKIPMGAITWQSIPLAWSQHLCPFLF